MKLKKAIQTAAKFVAKDGVKSRIRAIPATPGFRARIYANNGQVGVLLDLDEGLNVPNATFDTKLFLQLVKEGEPTKFERSGYGNVDVYVGASKYQMNDCADPANSVASYGTGFPMPPAIWSGEVDWPLVLKILHAVSDDDDKPTIKCVHFRPDGWVAATDEKRIARVHTRTLGRSGVVPAEVFKHWPSGGVCSAFQQNTVFFRIGDDETRMVVPRLHPFPDTDAVFPAEHAGHDAVVVLAELQRAVKRASALSPARMASLEFAPSKLMIKAWNETPQTFEANIVCDTMATATIVVSGKFLCDALAEIDTPNVWLGFTNEKEPLRIEGPAFSEIIWPLNPTS